MESEINVQIKVEEVDSTDCQCVEVIKTEPYTAENELADPLASDVAQSVSDAVAAIQNTNQTVSCEVKIKEEPVSPVTESNRNVGTRKKKCEPDEKCEAKLRLKNPEVDEDLRGVKTDQSTNGNDLELSNGSFDDMHENNGLVLDKAINEDSNAASPQNVVTTSEEANMNIDEPCQEIDPADDPKESTMKTHPNGSHMSHDIGMAASITVESTEVTESADESQLTDDSASSSDDSDDESLDSDCAENHQETQPPISGPGEIESNSFKWPRHPNCKLSVDELKTMAAPIPDKRSREDFFYFTYRRGKDPDVMLKKMLSRNVSGGSSREDKWQQHPDCKHTLEELNKMSTQIQTKRYRQRFVYLTYCKGYDPKEKLTAYLLMDSNKPRVELRKMSKILPKKLRTKFYCRAMRNNNSQSLMRKYLSRPQIQQWMLCKRLKLSDNKLLSKLFQPLGQKTNKKDSPPRPLKEWFTIFLQEGSVDEAIGKVKKLILQGPAPENTSEGCSSDVPADLNKSAESGYSRKFGKNSRSRREKKFKAFNKDQMKVYNSWVEQGLSHQDALTIVLGFPGEHRRWNNRNVCAFGKCDKHPQHKVVRTNQNGAKAQNGANESKSFSSEPAPPKKPIFDRIPVPSVIVDTIPPVDLPVEPQIGYGSNPPLTPQVPVGNPSVEPPCSLNTVNVTTSATSTGPTPVHLALGSQGPRVPQKSAFVEEPSSSQPVSHQLDDSLHLCVVPPGYPDNRLSDEEMDAIENSIRIAISGISDVRMKPIFKNKFKNKGRYEMVCKDRLAKKWVQKFVCCMKPVFPLEIIPAEPAKIRAKAFLPLSENDGTDEILEVLARQNEGLNVSRWEVVERSICGENVLLNLLVDEGSAKILDRSAEVNFKVGNAKITIEDEDRLSQGGSDKSGQESVSSKGRLPDKRTSTRRSSEQGLSSDNQRLRKGFVDSSINDTAKTPHSEEPSRPPYGRRFSQEYSGVEQYGFPGPAGYGPGPVGCIPYPPNPNFYGGPDFNMGPRMGPFPRPFEPRGFVNGPRCNNFMAPGMGRGFVGPPRFPPPFRGPRPMGFLPPRPIFPGMNRPGFNPNFMPEPIRPPFIPQHDHPSNGFFLERPKMLEQPPKQPSRSPSPDFDELLKSARSRLNLPAEPTEPSKSSEHSKQNQSKLSHAPTERTRDRSPNEIDRRPSNEYFDKSSYSSKLSHAPSQRSHDQSSNRIDSRHSDELSKTLSSKQSHAPPKQTRSSNRVDSRQSDDFCNKLPYSSKKSHTAYERPRDRSSNRIDSRQLDESFDKSFTNKQSPVLKCTCNLSTNRIGTGQSTDISDKSAFVSEPNHSSSGLTRNRSSNRIDSRQRDGFSDKSSYSSKKSHTPSEHSRGRSSNQIDSRHSGGFFDDPSYSHKKSHAPSERNRDRSSNRTDSRLSEESVDKSWLSTRSNTRKRSRTSPPLRSSKYPRWH